MTTPLKRQSLPAAIADRLRATIVAGELQAGARLAGHRDLARQYDVSVGSVREALSMLMSEGFVEIRPGSGTFVATAAGRRGPTTPQTLPEIRDLIEARKVIESRVASLAADRATPEQLEAIGSALKRMEAAADDPLAFVEADLAFHLAIAAAANNRYLRNSLDDLRELLRDDIRLSVETAFDRTGTLQPSLALHRELTRRIVDGDGTGAARAALAILERNEQFVLGLYSLVDDAARRQREGSDA
jgi:GntR family transcriptional repressor for pyruvate dehydrogenase complex